MYLNGAAYVSVWAFTVDQIVFQSVEVRMGHTDFGMKVKMTGLLASVKYTPLLA